MRTSALVGFSECLVKKSDYFVADGTALIRY